VETILEMSKTNRDVLNSYEKASPWHNLMNQIYFLGADKLYRSELVESLNLESNHILLNLCCGTGIDFPYLLKAMKSQGILVGVDISSGMLHQVRRRIRHEGIHLVRADMSRLPFRETVFDAILVSFCFKISPSYEKAIDEVAKVLKPAGRIGVLGNHKPSGLLKLPGSILTKVLSMISKVDFEIDLRDHLSRNFAIIEDRKMHWGLVQSLIGEKTKKDFEGLGQGNSGLVIDP
jgi:ubiquinone/menaquinone biosynthesis C-methylase UbiE